MAIVAVAAAGANCSEKAPPAKPADKGGAAAGTDPAEGVVLDDAHRQQAQKLIDGGVKWLVAHREDDGAWSLGQGAAKPAVTAMVLKALVQHGDYGTDHPAVQEGFRRLLSYQQADGGIYDPKQGQENYTTAVAVMALVAAEDPNYKTPLNKAVKYLQGLQIVPGSESPDGQTITEEHPWLGGVSYGKHGRPDLSNLGMWMQAMKDANVPPDDPHLQRALVFVTRTQNLSETNPRPWVKGGPDDGGAIYAPAIRGDLDMGESKAGPGPGGHGLRSYGSMTYTAFKSLLYAGVDRKDPRVQAAFKWIRRHWRLDSNPNMPAVRSKQGLFYYYHVFAKALRAWGQPVIADSRGRKHNWRHELIEQLAKIVQPDGSWQNDAPRWYEKQPMLATAYSVLALQEATKG
jgi:squalene-hopene/tetraprenyl-beta-curcumene cyclase